MDKPISFGKNGEIHATVTVEDIYDANARLKRGASEEDYLYPVEAITQDIYMVFATDGKRENGEEPKELQRTKFILKFDE